MNNTEFTIITFYQFKKTHNLEKINNILKNLCFFNKIRGTILIAKEGINGTVAGLDNAINLFQNNLKEFGFKNLQIKRTSNKYMPFNRLKIKIKKEIVTFDGNLYDVEKFTANHVNSHKWNKLISDKNTMVIDVRNNFEYEMGTFKNSTNPKTKNFSEFKKFVNFSLNKFKDKKIAMFCTGGIRCEKASSYMLKKGFKNLYQLEGGILKYLEEVPKKKSLWKGECFVFDNRVSVKDKQMQGSYSLCHGCRYPINSKDKKSKQFEEGVRCPRCYDSLSKEKIIRLRERNKQIKISKKKGIYNPYIKLTAQDF